MIYRLAADLVVVVHLGFVAFVLFGALLGLRWPRVAWVHLPVAVYGAAIEFVGWVCPLTPLENHLRRRGGEAGYPGGFVEHYLLPVLYPAGLTKGLEITLGLIVLALNLGIYAIVVRRWRRRERA